MMRDWTHMPGTATNTKVRLNGSALEVRTDYTGQGVIDQVSTINRALRERPQRDSALGHYVGTIPIELYESWIKDPRFNEPGFLRRKLMDRDFSKLRAEHHRKLF